MTRHFGRQISIQVGFHLKQLPYSTPAGHFWSAKFVSSEAHLKQIPTLSPYTYPHVRQPSSRVACGAPAALPSRAVRSAGVHVTRNSYEWNRVRVRVTVYPPQRVHSSCT